MTLNWIEIPATDLERACGFYGQVFGWTIERDERFAGYPMFRDPSGHVGGGFSGSWQPGPSGFVPHLEVRDIEATLRAIEEHGGSVVREKTPIPGIGHYALFRDPEGNVLGVHDSEALGR